MARAKSLMGAIFVAATLSAPAHAQVAPADAPRANADEDVRGSLEVFGGVGTFAVGKLNDRLQSAGYETLKSGNFTVGGHAHAALGRLLIGGTGAYFQGAESDGPANEKTRYLGGWGGVDVGYLVVDEKRVGLAPMLTLGGYGFTLQLHEVGSRSFDAALRTPPRDAQLTQQGVLLGVSLPVTLRIPTGNADVPRRGLLIGLRPGFLYGIQIGDWSHNGSRLTDGPRSGLTGGYLVLTVGAGA